MSVAANPGFDWLDETPVIDAADLVEISDLEEITFGDFLVDRGALTRAELAEATRLAAEHPLLELRDVICWLGFSSHARLDALEAEWEGVPVVEIG